MKTTIVLKNGLEREMSNVRPAIDPEFVTLFEVATGDVRDEIAMSEITRVVFEP